VALNDFLVSLILHGFLAVLLMQTILCCSFLSCVTVIFGLFMFFTKFYVYMKLFMALANF